MARAWTVALVGVLVVAVAGCGLLGIKKEEKTGTVEIRVPVAEKKPAAPKPKVTPAPKVEKPKVTPTPKVAAPKPVLVPLKRGVGVDIAKLFNNDAFTDKADRKDSNLDQWGQSFPAEELPAAGKFCKKQLPSCFLFPTKDPKKKNNIACAGQTIPLAGKAKALYLLVTATDANQEDKVAIAYADGKVDQDLKVTDWCAKAQFGEAAAASSAHRVALIGPPNEALLKLEEKKCTIWCVTIPLDAKRELKSIKLPYNAQIHIFALTLAK